MGNCHSNVNLRKSNDVFPPKERRPSRVFARRRSSQTQSQSLSKRASVTKSVRGDTPISSVWGITTQSDVKEEISRQETHHAVLKHVWEGNYAAPVEDALNKGIKVLDFGAGAGAWTIDMAQTYPNSRFTAFDVLSLVTHNESLPSNLELIVGDNIGQALSIPDNTYDYVHARSLAGYLTRRQWDTAIKDIVRICKPGGWIELVESDPSVSNQGPNTKRLVDAMLGWTTVKGLTLVIFAEVPKMLESNPLLTNVEQSSLQVPLGRWAGNYGHLALQVATTQFQRVKRYNLEFMGASSKDYDRILETIDEEVDQHRSYSTIHRFFAQKTITQE